MNDPEFLKPVKRRITFRDAETDECVSVRVEARGSIAATSLTSHQVEEGDLGHRRAWHSFECFESQPDREWAATSGRLCLLRGHCGAQTQSWRGTAGTTLRSRAARPQTSSKGACEYGQGPRTDRR